MKTLAIATIAVLSLAALTGLPAAAQDESDAIRTLNVTAVPDLDRASLRKVQGSLEAKGFDPGPIDGIVGPQTKAAVRRFQERYGMKASGDIDNQLLLALGRADIAGRR